MSTITWAADVSGDFATAANWSPAKVPGSGDAVNLAPAGTASFTVTSSTKETMASLLTGSFATLDITAGSFVVTKSLAVDGTVTAAAGAVLDVGPTIVNAGEIDLASTTAGKYSRMAIDSAIVSLTGAGVVSLAADGEITGASSSNELLNASTITGGGTLGAASMALMNAAAGVIDGSAGMVADTGDQTFRNDGLIEATGGGVGLVLSSSTLQNRYGTVAANGGTLALASSTIENGVLTTSGAGIILNQGSGVILDGIGYGLTNSGAFQFQGTLGLEGTITNTGEFVEMSGGDAQIRLDANVSLLGSGTLAFNTSGSNTIYSVTPGNTLTNVGTTAIQGDVAVDNAALTNLAGGVIDSQGQVDVFSKYTVENAGVIEASAELPSGGYLSFNSLTVDNSNGVIAATGRGAERGDGIELRNSTIVGGAISTASGGFIGSDRTGGLINLTGGGSITNGGAILARNLSYYGPGVDLVIKGGVISGSGTNPSESFLSAWGGDGATITLLGVTLLGAGAYANQLETEPLSQIAIDDGTTLQTAGWWENPGTIAVTSTGAYTDVRVLAAGVTLYQGGTIILSGPKARILGATASATLTNTGNTIVGAGAIGFDNMKLINEGSGVIDATGLLTVRDAPGARLTNGGLMEASATGQLALVAETIDQSGGGEILAAGGLVTLQGVDVIRGTLTTTGAGRINVDSDGATLDGKTATVTNAGLLQVTGGQTLTVDGSIINTGKLDLHAAKLLVGAGGAIFSGSGQVNLNNSVRNVIVGATATATLTNTSDRIAGSGDIGDGSMVLINQASGQIIGNQSVALTLDTGTATIINAGLIENTGKGGTKVLSAVVNTGTLKAATAGTLTLAGTVTGAGLAQVNGGTLYVQQAFAENVAFTGATGVLKLGDSQAYTGKVTGFSKTGTNSLDLADIAFSNTKTKATYSGTTASGILTVTDGTHTAKITLIGNYTTATFTLSSDGHTGTKVVDPAAGSSTAPLAQAIAAFQHGPPAHLAATSAYGLPRLPIFHAQA